MKGQHEKFENSPEIFHKMVKECKNTPNHRVMIFSKKRLTKIRDIVNFYVEFTEAETIQKNKTIIEFKNGSKIIFGVTTVSSRGYSFCHLILDQEDYKYDELIEIKTAAYPAFYAYPISSTITLIDGNGILPIECIIDEPPNKFKSLKACLKQDMDNDDHWFVPAFDDEEKQFVWVMKSDHDIFYDFGIPFFDNDWVIHNHNNEPITL